MQHDIYSLGVCLLEIVLGALFVDYEVASIRDAALEVSYQYSHLNFKQEFVDLQ